MKLKEDSDTFDEWQNSFAYEILRTIKEELDKASLPKEKLQELTTAIGFQVACLLDASTPFVVEEEQIIPILTFSTNGKTLIHQDGPSDMHDYIHGNADELFDE